MNKIVRLVCVVLGLSGAAFAQTTIDGFTIPASHPTMFWTPTRVTTAQVWVTSSGYTLRTTNDPFRPLDGYDNLFACVVGNTTACTNAVTALAGFTDVTCSSVGDDQMRVLGEWSAISYDWLFGQLSSGQRSTYISNMNTWVPCGNAVSWGGPTMPASNYFAGKSRTNLDYSVATFNENGSPATSLLTYWNGSHWPALINFVSLSGTGALGKAGYALHNIEGGGEYGRYSLDYYALQNAASVLLGRDLWQETTAFQSGVLQTIYNTTPKINTARGSWDQFTWGDDQNWGSGNGCNPISYNGYNGATGTGGCQGQSQYYGDYLVAAATEFNSIAIGKLARTYLSTVQPSEGPIFLSVDPGGSSQAFSTLPLDYYSSGAQYMYARNNWTTNATDVLWQMGYNQGGGHAHDDVGSFQVMRKGVDLIRETPTYAETVAGYNSVGTVLGNLGYAHSQPIIGGLANQTLQSCADGPGTVDRLETQTGYAFAAVDLTLTYQNTVCDPSNPSRANPYAALVLRELYYIRGIDTLIVVDRLQTDTGTRSTTFVSHCETNPTVSGATVACIDGGQEATYTALVPASPTTVIVNESANGATAGNWQYRIEGNNANPGNVVSYQIWAIQLCDSGSCALTPSVVDSNPGSPTSGTFTITLDASNAVTVQKGTTSTGGTITAAGTTRSLTSTVETMTITPAGNVWGTPIAATPTFAPVAGTYAGTQTVTISTTSGSVICYNTTGTPVTNGAAGCTTGTLYTTPVSVAASETLFAVSGGTGFVDSSVGSAAYVINGAATTPTFSPVAGTYTGTQSVTLSTATSGCASFLVWNTTNAQSGGNLTGTSSTNPLNVASSETVYAQVQSCPTYLNSSIGSAAYTINAPAPSQVTIGNATITGTLQ